MKIGSNRDIIKERKKLAVAKPNVLKINSDPCGSTRFILQFKNSYQKAQ